MRSGLVNPKGEPIESAPEREIGCVVCGRGQLKVALPGGRNVDTSLEKVRCTDENAHRPGGSHEGKCLGWVYRHRNTQVCQAVRRQAKRN